MALLLRLSWDSPSSSLSGFVPEVASLFLQVTSRESGVRLSMIKTGRNLRGITINGKLNQTENGSKIIVVGLKVRQETKNLKNPKNQKLRIRKNLIFITGRAMRYFPNSPAMSLPTTAILSACPELPNCWHLSPHVVI